ncbi:MAG: hypothetical protein IJF38_03785 [Clostridia bacterium]|nr:hypothetical protein [Clostridia bacterium]
MDKTKLSIIAVIALVLIAAVVIVALNFDTVKGLFDSGKPDGEPSEFPEDDEPLDGLILIRKNEAKFNIITASGAGSAGIRAANELYSTLAALGIDVNAPIPDVDPELVWHCEIIIGSECQNRGEECLVDVRELGYKGYCIKAVGERIVIVGGSPAKTREAVEIFTEKYLGITDTTKSLRNKAVSQTLNETVLTDYDIDSLSIGGQDIAQYTVVCDTSDTAIYPNLTATFAESVSMLTGKYLEVVDRSAADALTHRIIFRTLPLSFDAEGKRTYADGFYVRVEGNDLIFECEYENAFVKFYDEFMEEYVLTKTGSVDIPQGLNISKCASIVKYSDFGAFGDDDKDDFSYILEAHEYANLGRQKVVADGEVYRIGMGGSQIPIMTDVDWKEARFIIDDNAKGVNRRKHIFILKRENPMQTYVSLNFEDDGVTDLSLKKGESDSIPWLDKYLDYDSLVVIQSNHADYVRYGANGNLGRARTDVLHMDKDAKLDPKTPVTNDYDVVAQVQIFRVDDTPITVNGGFFENICARSGCEHNDEWECYKGRNNPDGVYEKYCRSNVYTSVSRGIRIERPNSTLMNIYHKVVDEPEDGSFPYYGFLLFYNAHNVTVKDCNLTGHKYYVEYKTNDYGDINWVPMGTYDFVCEYSNELYFDGVTQENGRNDIGDSGYWGIMSSNGSKNLHFTDCIISRIDAHCGFWNMTVDNTIIGHTFNVIGGGTLEVRNTQRRVGNSFISLRGDYGATFEGDLIIENCLLDGIVAYDTVWGGAKGRPSSRYGEGYIVESGFLTSTKYMNWDFGYTCYLPITVTVTNFQSNISNLYVYNGLSNKAFDASYPNQYQITKKITVIRDNTKTLPAFIKAGSIRTSITVAPSGASRLNSIPYETKTVN